VYWKNGDTRTRTYGGRDWASDNMGGKWFTCQLEKGESVIVVVVSFFVVFEISRWEYHLSMSTPGHFVVVA